MSITFSASSDPYTLSLFFGTLLPVKHHYHDYHQQHQIFRIGPTLMKVSCMVSGRRGRGLDFTPRKRPLGCMDGWFVITILINERHCPPCLFVRPSCILLINTRYESVDSILWVGMGEGMQSDHLTWRHTCLAIDFIEVPFWGKISKNLKEYFKILSIEFCKRGTQNCMRMGGNISSKNQWKISRQVTKLLQRKSTSYLSGKLFRTSILFQESELCFQRFQEFRPRNLSSSVLTFFRCFSSSSGVFFQFQVCPQGGLCSSNDHSRQG